MVPRWGGRLLLLSLLAYLIHAARDDRGADPDPVAVPGLSFLAAGAWLIFGLAALMIGARLLVDGAVAIARDLGLSEAFIGLTIVAIGTSLPELATSVTAALRRQSAIAIGNVIGSNIFNALGILGATAVIAPLNVAPRFAALDIPIALGVAVVLSLLLWRGGVGRWSACGLLASYAAYLSLTA